MKTIKFTLLGILLLLSAEVKPATFTVTDNLLDNLALNAQTTSLFYINNFLPAEPYQINSAMFEFNFGGLADLEFADTIVTTVTDTTTHFVDIYNDSDQESILLSIGSSVIFEESVFNSETLWLSTQEGGTCTVLGCNIFTNVYYQENNGYYEGIPGTVSGYLGAGDLLNLGQMGWVFWSLETTGGLNLNSATLTVDYSLLNVSAVPVPAAVWLFGTALIGLVGFSKRRKTA